jgi:hypothetical protein
MFDYQAGEKYKLTLIMVGVTGIIVGASLTLMLAAPGEAPPPKRGHGGGRARNFEGREGSGPSLRATGGGQGAMPQMPQVEQVDKGQATALVDSFLPLTYDFNSTTSGQSQERAMQLMTPECAQLYKANVWTDEIAQKVGEAGMTSSFQRTSCQAITSTDDGSVVVKVEGDQTLVLQGQPPRPKHVIMEYLVKKTPGGLKVSGISESGNFGT